MRDWGSWFSSPVLPPFLLFSVQRLLNFNALPPPTLLTSTARLSSPALAFVQGLNLSPVLCLHHIPLPEKPYLSPGLKAQAPEICMSIFHQNSFSNVISKVSEIVFGKKWGPDDAIRIQGPHINIHGLMIRRLWTWFRLVMSSLWNWFCLVTVSLPESSLTLNLWALPPSLFPCLLTEIACFPWPCGKIHNATVCEKFAVHRGPVSASGSPCKVLPPEWNEVGGSAKNSHVVVESMKKKRVMTPSIS